MQIDLEAQSADGPQAAGLVIKPFLTVAENSFSLVSGTKAQYESPFNCSPEILLLTYLLTYTHKKVIISAVVLA